MAHQRSRRQPAHCAALVALLMLVAASLGQQPAQAATITVNSTADDLTAQDGACTLREAIANVNAAADLSGGDCGAGTGSGDTIVFNLTLPATIVLTIYVELELYADVTITGPRTGPLMVDGNGQVNVFAVTTGIVNITNLTIQNGQGSNGRGGVYNGGVLSLTDCMLSNNTAFDRGGGVYNDTAGTLTLTNCTLNANQADDSGGGVYSDGTMTMTGCTLGGNTSNNGDGGGVYSDIHGTAVLTNCTLAVNSSNASGGGVYNAGTMTVTTSTFSDNGHGGGAYNSGALTLINCGMNGNAGGIFNTGTLTLTGGTLTGNASDHVGGIFNDSEGMATLTDCTLETNSSRASGSIDNEGTMSATGCRISGGWDDDSFGSVYNNGELTLNNCTLSGGVTGLFNDDAGTATLTDSVVSDNVSEGYSGAGINNSGTLTLNNCTLSGNSASGISHDYGSGGGGGIYNGYGATVTLTNCTLSNNSTIDGDGGALDNEGTATLTNCTLSGNVAAGAGNYTTSGGGGGISNTGTLTLTNCTVSSNVAGHGANIICPTRYSADSNCSTTLINTIVANGIGSENCTGRNPIVDGGHNIDSDGTCAVGPATDPLLDPAGLADNGGPTQTIALQAGSPAINAGDPGVCAAPPVDNHDQRGVSRPGQGSMNCSIGAYEYVSPFPCCQCPSSCSVPERGSCGSCTLVLGAACEDGQLCVANTPTPTMTFTPTPTSTCTPTITPTITPTPSATPVLCCQCANFCVIPIDGLCRSCSPVPDASCADSLCLTHTPTATTSPTPTVSVSPTGTPTDTPTATPTVPASPTATPLATPTSTPSCAGDCDGSGAVTVNELVLLVNIDLGAAEASACPLGIPTGASVDITLIVKAVGYALTSCPAP